MHIQDLINTLEEGLKMPFSFLINPNKRIYFGYIITSVLLAFYVFKREKIRSSFTAYILSKKIWLGNSARVDYWLIFFNSFVKILFIGPFLIWGLYIAFYTNEFLMESFGIRTFNISTFNLILLYTISLTLLNDFTSFLLHYLQHKIPFLWEFHKIHHSATELNPVTQYRIHPVELIMNNARVLVVFGVLAGVFDYLSVEKIDKFTFIGVNIFSFVFLVFGANLRHSHVKLTYFNFLEYIFISPFQHQIHHSNNPKHFNKNMGAKLAIWDYMFGTLVRSKEVENIEYGLGEEDKNYDSFLKNLKSPFVNVYRGTHKLISKIFRKK